MMDRKDFQATRGSGVSFLSSGFRSYPIMSVEEENPGYHGLTPREAARRPRLMSRRPPSKRLSQMAEALFNRTHALDLTGQHTRLGVRKVLQELLGAEVTEALGRELYKRREDSQGYRNGYKTRRLLTAEGPLQVDVLQARDSYEPFRSRL